MSQPKLVIDTNVLVSALLKPDSLENQVIEFALTEGQWCVSDEIIDEYRQVLARGKFGFDQREVAVFLSSVNTKWEILWPHRSVNVCSDPEDDKFLQCAAACGADYFVTGNLKHFPIGMFSEDYEVILPDGTNDVMKVRTKIVNARMFLADVDR